MNLKEQLQPILAAKPYKGKTIAEIERIAGIGQGTLRKAFLANNGHGSIRTSIIEKLAEPTGKYMKLTFKGVK